MKHPGRPFYLSFSLIFAFAALTIGGWLAHDGVEVAHSSAPSNHIDPDDVMVWKGFSSFTAHDIAVDPTDNTKIYMGTGYPTAFAYSYDYGSTWFTRTVGPNAFSDGLAIAVDPVSPNRLFLSVTPDRIYRSTDSGDTWQQVDGGVTNGTRVSRLFVHPVTPTLVFGSSDSGTPEIYRSTDGGDSWDGILIIPGPTNRKIIQLFLHPTLAKRLYAVTGSFKVYVSDDLGDTWADTGFDGGPFVVASDNPNVMYKLTNTCYTYRSTNAGASWTQLPRPESACYEGLAVDPNDGDYIYQWSQYRSIARSLDGGQNWEFLIGRDNNGPWAYYMTIDPVDTTRLYTGDGVYVSILLDNYAYIPFVGR